MERKLLSITAAAVLRIVRDEPSVTYETLQDRFEAHFGERNHKLYAILVALADSGVVNWASDEGRKRISVTKSWMTVQNLLDLQLPNDHESDHAVLTVRPFFGAPQDHLQFESDLFVLMPFKNEIRPVYDDHIAKVASELGLSVKLADDFFGIQNIVDEIWSAICAARVSNDN